MRNYYKHLLQGLQQYRQNVPIRPSQSSLIHGSTYFSLVAPIALVLLVGMLWLGGANERPNKLTTESITVAPKIGVAKSFTSFDGSNLVIDIFVKNTGSESLSNLTLTDVLDDPSNFGAAFQMITVNPNLTSSLAVPPMVNPMYDGRASGQPNILDGSSGVLPPGESFSVSFTILIDFNAVGAKTAVQNQAVAGGLGMSTSVSDLSDAGTDPEGTNPGQGGDTGGSDDPNLLFICTTNDCFKAINLSLDPDCQREITPDMLLMQNDLARIRPDFYKVQLSFGNGLIISDNTLRMQHVGQNIKALIWYDGPQCMQGQMCMTNITLKNEPLVFFESDSVRTVYCNDPFLKIDPASNDYPYKPTATQSCGGQVKGPFYAGDWVMIHDCVLGQQDTAKTIIRQWWAESKDGKRHVDMDTIHVLRLPPLSPATFSCNSKDTIYCGSPRTQGGPYLLIPDPQTGIDCDTIYLLTKNYQAATFDNKCGLSVKVDSLIFQNTGCSKLKRYTVQVHQDCYGTAATGPCTVPMGQSEVIIEGGAGQPIAATCTFWLTEIDTLPPQVYCNLNSLGQIDTIDGYPTLTLPAGPDCSAMVMELPDVAAHDICNQVILVKAMIDTLGPFSYKYDSASGNWKSDGQLTLPLRQEPYLIALEAYDECFNIGRDTCAVLVADQTNPTAVAHPGLTLELSSKLAYVNASQINNNSFDNCGLNLVLARRTDWQAHWPDFCDSIRFYSQAGPDLDTIWCKQVESDAAINEFEAFYAEAISNFTMMMGDCGLLLYQSWFYDLCRYGTVDCKGAMSEEKFKMLYSQLHPETEIEVVAQIGGGWADAVPFTCEDVCQEIPVELLVMDFWCNWSTSWSKVLVEDKSMPDVAAEITPTVTMSCSGYRGDSVFFLPGINEALPLSTIVSEAELGDSAALALLNQTLGGYEKAWVNGMNQYVDAHGNVIDPQFTFTDRGICQCLTVTRQIRYYDVASMSFMTMDSMVTACSLDSTDLLLNHGIIAVNCSENVICQQTVTSNFDNCGLGIITREFQIWKTCGNESSDTIRRTQQIELVNHCMFSKALFELPSDTVITACSPTFDPGFSGNVIGEAHPDLTGRPEFIPNEGCRDVGLAYQDKVLTNINPSTACYIIWRTWYFAEWCNGNVEQPNWWLNQNLVMDSFTQVIVLIDTVPPECSIEIMNQVQDTVRANNCVDNLPVRFFTFDTCGTQRYNYWLDTMSNPPQPRAFGGTLLPGDVRDTMPVTILNVRAGRYRLRISIDDHCNNTGVCADTFVIVCDVSSQTGMVDRSLEEQQMNQLDKSGKETLPGEGITPPVDFDSQPLHPVTFELYQNRPNPFRSNTVIGFNLPESDDVRLSIYDIQGRKLKVVEGKFNKGYQEIEVKYHELRVKGLLYYQLETSAYSATRRMLITP